MQSVGIPATPEFVSYIRTQKYTKCDYSKIAQVSSNENDIKYFSYYYYRTLKNNHSHFFIQSLNYNKDQRNNASYNPPMNPYDLNFHRGKKDKKAGKIHFVIRIFIIKKHQ